MPFVNGVPYAVTLDGENMRVALTRLLLEVQAKMLAERTDDIRGFEMLLQVTTYVQNLSTLSYR